MGAPCFCFALNLLTCDFPPHSEDISPVLRSKSTGIRQRVIVDEIIQFSLPETIVPHSIIALGYPEADITAPRASRYEADRVHFNQW